MMAFFESKGWEYEVLSDGQTSVHEVRADTGEGFLVEWMVQTRGQYNIRVMSKTFWGDTDGLISAIADRILPGSLDIGDSVPGVRPSFPNWEDPADYAPRLLDHDSGELAH